MRYKKYTTDQIREMKRRYRERTGACMYEPRSWSPEDDELVLHSELSDRDLGKLLRRSVGAIQHRRNRLKRGLKYEC